MLLLQTRRLGDSDIYITPVGIGTAPIGSSPEWQVDWGPQDENKSIQAIRTSIEIGVNWIDTAPFYGWGRAERIVGKAVQGLRDRVSIFTKCGTIRDGNGSFESLKPEVIRQEVSQSLERLGIDYIDLLQFHDPDPSTTIEESWQTVQKLIEEGLVRHAGLSNHPIDLVERARGIGPVASLQIEYNPLVRTPEKEIMPYCQSRQVGILGWGSLAEGFLADGFSLDSLSPADFRRRHRFSRPENHKRIEKVRDCIQKVATAHHARMVDVVIAWELFHPALTGAIVGIRNQVEAVQMIEGTKLQLSDEDLTFLENGFEE